MSEMRQLLLSADKAGKNVLFPKVRGGSQAKDLREKKEQTIREGVNQDRKGGAMKNEESSHSTITGWLKF